MARTYLAKEINSDLITKKISVRSWKEVRTKFFEVAVTHGASQNRLQAVVDEFFITANAKIKMILLHTKLGVKPSDCSAVRFFFFSSDNWVLSGFGGDFFIAQIYLSLEPLIL